MALVAFNDQVDLLASMGQLNGEQLSKEIEAIYPRGSANLSGVSKIPSRFSGSVEAAVG